MDLNKLNANEKLAVYGSGAAIIGAILAQVGSIFGAGGLWLTVLLAIAMLVIVFLPQWSPQTTLPGSKGSLMLIVGGIAALGALLGLLAILGALSIMAAYGGLWFVGILIGIVGGLLMGWAAWQEFQAEGGKFVLGTPAGGSTSAAAAPRTDTTPPPAAPAAPATDVDDERPASPTV